MTFTIGQILTAAELNALDTRIVSLESAPVANIAELKALDKTKVPYAHTKGYWLAGDGGAGTYWYDATDTASADNGVTVIVALDGGRWKLLYVNSIAAELFGIVGDGTTDNAVRLQYAADSQLQVTFANKVYRTTQSIQLKPGTKFIGAGNWSAFGINVYNISGILTAVYPTYYYGTTIFLYDGVAGDDIAVINVSATTPGIMPTETDPRNANYRNIENVGLTNITIDGNGKAGLGLYIYRGLIHNTFDGITVIRTTKHAFLVQQSWNGNVRRWAAVLNQGCGITLGKDVWGYGATFCTVDITLFQEMFAQYNGCDANRNYLNQWSEASQDKEYGFGLYTGRANTVKNISCDRNGGVGLYVTPDRFPNKFDGVYTEKNCQSSLATNYYGIWYQGLAGSVSRHCHFSNVYFGTGLATEDGIKLTGVEPSRLAEDAVVFNNVPIVTHIEADWSNYILEYVDSTVIITGTQPYKKDRLVGTLAATVSGGAIATTQMTGIIASVEYLGLGSYRIYFVEAFADPEDYVITAIGQNDRYVSLGTKGYGSCTLNVQAFNPGVLGVSLPGFNQADTSFFHFTVTGKI